MCSLKNILTIQQNRLTRIIFPLTGGQKELSENYATPSVFCSDLVDHSSIIQHQQPNLKKAMGCLWPNWLFLTSIFFGVLSLLCQALMRFNAGRQEWMLSIGCFPSVLVKWPFSSCCLMNHTHSRGNWHNMPQTGFEVLIFKKTSPVKSESSLIQGPMGFRGRVLFK